MSHLEIVPASAAQLSREDHRERVGSDQVEAKRKRPPSEVETDTVRGYWQLSPDDLVVARRAIGRVTREFPGLDDALVESKALDALALGMIEYPMECEHVCEYTKRGENDSPSAVERGWHICEVDDAEQCHRCEIERPRRIAGRAMKQARWICGRAPTGRGRMPRVDDGEREPASPDYALWVGLADSMRIDTRCWCHRGESCTIHRVEVEHRGDTIDAFARTIEAPTAIGKAGKSMRWLASHYREPDSIAIGASIEARRANGLLDHSAMVNQWLDHSAVVAVLGDAYAVRTKSGRYLWSSVDIQSALDRWMAATGERETRKTFRLRVVRALRTAANGASQHRASIEPVGEPATIERVEPASRLDHLPAALDALRVELGPRAWLAFHRVERHTIETPSRVEASGSRWVLVEARLTLREAGRVVDLPATLFGIEHRGDCDRGDNCRCGVSAATAWTDDRGGYHSQPATTTT